MVATSAATGTTHYVAAATALYELIYQAQTFYTIMIGLYCKEKKKKVRGCGRGRGNRDCS